MRILRFLCSGAIGISVNLGTLHLLAGILGVYYLLASVIAISCSTVVGFLLQKYWTFEEHSATEAPRQFAMYAVLAITNIGINTGIVYGMTEILGFHYLVGQFVGAGVVAGMSYLVYRGFIFKKRLTPIA